MSAARVRWFPLLALCTVVLGAPAAAPAAAQTATRLQVDVAGVPVGSKPDVMISGPGGFRSPVTGSATLEGVAPGRYAVSAAPIRRDGRFADELWEPDRAAASVQVIAGRAATVRITYRLRGGTGMLWVAESGDYAVHGLTDAQLGESGKPPTRKVRDVGSRYVRGIAVTPDGDVWLTGEGAGTLVLRKAAQLAGAGKRAPTLVLTPTGEQRGLDGIAIAPDGHLWVADRNKDQLLGFAPAQLRRAGRVAPEVVIAQSAEREPGLQHPSGLAFDSSGNLWVSNIGGGGNVSMYTAAQLAASGNPEPATILRNGRGSTIREPSGLAFDARGNLWVALRYGPIQKFTPEQLRGSGQPQPAASLPVEAISRQTSLVGLAFDEAGNLWVANHVNPARVAMYRAADLEDPSAAPATLIDLGVQYLDHLAFSLAPRGLPLAGAAAAEAAQPR